VDGLAEEFGGVCGIAVPVRLINAPGCRRAEAVALAERERLGGVERSTLGFGEAREEGSGENSFIRYSHN
jgi:hypothetical protein